jgi:DNA-binding transcriptional LysR family regulator
MNETTPNAPHISLDQWRALLAVVDAGGYAQAAEVLHKTQSAVTYSVQKLESLLGVKAFEIQGRKALLTPTGQLLYRRAMALVEEAVQIERAAKKLSAGWEAEIRLAVEILFPAWLLFKCLDRFANESAHTRIEVFETVLNGTAEALEAKQVDIALSPRIPAGFQGEPIMRLRFIPAAHPDHPLHRLKREITLQDLKSERHLVVRDSGARRSTSATTVDVDQRWTFSNMSTSILAARSGFGFAWYPEEKIREELHAGLLKPLPMRDGAERWVEIYLIYADRDAAGPGILKLAEIIRALVKTECEKSETV